MKTIRILFVLLFVLCVHNVTNAQYGWIYMDHGRMLYDTIPMCGDSLELYLEDFDNCYVLPGEDCTAEGDGYYSNTQKTYEWALEGISIPNADERLLWVKVPGNYSTKIYDKVSGTLINEATAVVLARPYVPTNEDIIHADTGLVGLTTPISLTDDGTFTNNPKYDWYWIVKDNANSSNWLRIGDIFHHLVEGNDTFSVVFINQYYSQSCQDTVSVSITGITEQISIGITVEEQVSGTKSAKSETGCSACVDGEQLGTVAIQYTGSESKSLRIKKGDGGNIFNSNVSTDQIISLDTDDWGESPTLSLELENVHIGTIYTDCSTSNGPGSDYGNELVLVEGTTLLDGSAVCPVNGDTTVVPGETGSTFLITISVSLYPGGPVEEISLLANGESVTVIENGGKKRLKSGNTEHLYEGEVIPDQDTTGCSVSASGRMSTANVSFKIITSQTTTEVPKIEPSETKLVYSSMMSNQLILSTTDKSAISKVVLYSITGQEMIHEKPNTSSVSFEVSHLTNGIYILNVMDNRGNIYKGKVVKQ